MRILSKHAAESKALGRPRHRLCRTTAIHALSAFSTDRAKQLAATEIFKKIVDGLTDDPVIALDAIDPYPIDPDEISRSMLTKLLNNSERLVELVNIQRALANTNL